MSLQIRRVVTGHDDGGRAEVQVDDLTRVTSGRPGHFGSVVWTTASTPADNDGAADASPKEISSTIAGGSVFRIVQYGPGVSARRHRTDSVDYAIVMSGEIDMELEPGDFVHLKAGDVLVQRGTIHNWVNNGTAPCTIAFVLIDAKPVQVAGKVLSAQG